MTLGPHTNRSNFCVAVAQQLEPLLLLAYSLRLEALQRRLAGCIAACCSDKNGILYGRLESVFTDRVLCAALPPTATDVEEMAFIEQVLTCKCGFVGEDGIRQLLRPVPHVGPPNRVLKFAAALTRDFMGSSEGDLVHVEVDLFESGFVKIGKVVLPAQLLLGQPITCQGDLRVLMTGKGYEEEDEEGEEEEGAEGDA